MNAENYQRLAELMIDLQMKFQEKSLNCHKFPAHIIRT